MQSLYRRKSGEASRSESDKRHKRKNNSDFWKNLPLSEYRRNNFDKIKKKLILPNEVKAPVKKGQKAGELVYYQENRELGRIPVIYAENVKKAGYLDRLKQTAEEVLPVKRYRISYCG